MVQARAVRAGTDPGPGCNSKYEYTNVSFPIFFES